jgi:hypothetical protein
MKTPDQDFLGVWSFIWALFKSVKLTSLTLSELNDLDHEFADEIGKYGSRLSFSLSSLLVSCPHPVVFKQADRSAVTLVNRYFNNILSVESAPITLLGTLVQVSCREHLLEELTIRSFMLTVKLNNDQKTWKDGIFHCFSPSRSLISRTSRMVQYRR